MPIKKNSDDYIDVIQKEIAAQFGISFPQQKIKKILDQILSQT